MVVCSKFKFDAAHFLPNYVGVCHNLHGHCWHIDIGIEGFINKETGMVLDFKELKAFINDKIIEKYDHKLLNDFIENPTAENIAKKIYQEIYQEILGKKPYCVCFVRVWETEDNYAEYSG